MRRFRISRRSFIGVSIGSPLFVSCAINRKTPTASNTPQYQNINDLLSSACEKDSLPAVAAGAIKRGKIVALGAVGVRKIGASTRVTMSDKFHIGSCTKAMTATVAAMLVEQARLRWDSTLAEIFPERADRMHADYRNVTLELLFTHRSGAPANGSFYGLPFVPVRLQRLAYLDSVVTNPPETKPGTTFNYSNAGYIFAGAMLERVTNQTWEELMQQRLFQPLVMNTAGFGPPSKSSEADGPWGHVFKNGAYVPRYGDNPRCLGPAGTVHCSVRDYLKFAGLHAGNGHYSRHLLTSPALARLHEPPPKADYAFGWAVTERKWAQGLTLTHNGSNTMNFFVTWIAPKIDFAIAVGSNSAGDNVPNVLDNIASQLVQKFAA